MSCDTPDGYPDLLSLCVPSTTEMFDMQVACQAYQP